LPYHLGEGERDQGQYRGLIPCAYVQGAALAIRRSLWNEMGGLDESFFPAYFEEADLCRRVRDAGWKVATVCSARAVHHQDARAQVQSPAFLKMLFRGRARYLRKHYRVWDWITKFLPAEIQWLLSASSKGYRRLALRALWESFTGGA
jgi:GT2 family glycosyltransferase